MAVLYQSVRGGDQSDLWRCLWCPEPLRTGFLFVIIIIIIHFWAGDITHLNYLFNLPASAENDSSFSSLRRSLENDLPSQSHASEIFNLLMSSRLIILKITNIYWASATQQELCKCWIYIISFLLPEGGTVHKPNFQVKKQMKRVLWRPSAGKRGTGPGSSSGLQGHGRGEWTWDSPGLVAEQNNRRQVLLDVSMTGLCFSSLPNSGVASPLQCMSFLVHPVDLPTGFSACLLQRGMRWLEALSMEKPQQENDSLFLSLLSTSLCPDPCHGSC